MLFLRTSPIGSPAPSSQHYLSPSLRQWNVTTWAGKDWEAWAHSEHRFPAPSLKERCRKPVLEICGLGSHSKHWFTTSFFWRKVSERDARGVTPSRDTTAYYSVVSLLRATPQATLSGTSMHWFTTSFLQHAGKRSAWLCASEASLWGTFLQTPPDYAVSKHGALRQQKS